MGILGKYIKEKEYYGKYNFCKTCEEIMRTKPRCLTSLICTQGKKNFNKKIDIKKNKLIYIKHKLLNQKNK